MAAPTHQRSETTGSGNRMICAHLRDLQALRQRLTDLCDEADAVAERERDPQSGLTGAAVVWVEEVRAILDGVE